MKTSRVISVVLALLVLIGVAGVFSHAVYASKPSSIAEFGPWVNHIVKDSLDDISAFEQLAPSIMVMGGAKEQDGIFIAENYLLENIKINDPAISNRNLDGIELFLKKHNIHFSAGYNEDGAFNTQCYMLSDKIGVLKRPV